VVEEQATQVLTAADPVPVVTVTNPAPVQVEAHAAEVLVKQATQLLLTN
jgi:hypothetical protein